MNLMTQEDIGSCKSSTRSHYLEKWLWKTPLSRHNTLHAAAAADDDDDWG